MYSNHVFMQVRCHFPFKLLKFSASSKFLGREAEHECSCPEPLKPGRKKQYIPPKYPFFLPHYSNVLEDSDLQTQQNSPFNSVILVNVVLYSQNTSGCPDTFTCTGSCVLEKYSLLHLSISLQTPIQH